MLGQNVFNNIKYRLWLISDAKQAQNDPLSVGFEPRPYKYMLTQHTTEK